MSQSSNPPPPAPDPEDRATWPPEEPSTLKDIRPPGRTISSGTWRFDLSAAELDD